MKKKEILIIFILALLVTFLSGLRIKQIGFVSDQPENILEVISPIGYSIFEFGFPLAWFISHPYNKVVSINLVVDFLFWFLILTVGWWVVKKIILCYKKDNEKS